MTAIRPESTARLLRAERADVGDELEQIVFAHLPLERRHDAG